MGKYIILLVIIVLLTTACNLSLAALDSAVNTESRFVGTIKEDTNCYLGPDPDFGIAAELKTDVQITIVGASQGGDYVVLIEPENPEKICWAELELIDIGSEALMAEFMRLNVEDPGSSDSDLAFTSSIFVELHPGSTDCGERAKEGDEPSGEVYACHSQPEYDYYCAECGEWVYPAYIIPEDDCEQNSACVTSSPPPPVFMACTPTSPQSESGWSADISSDPTPTFRTWSAEVATDPTPTFGTWSAEIASTPTPTLLPPFILDLTLCWNGPGTGYEVISSLQPDITVEVLGTGEGGGYIVVTNPLYNRPCWVEETEIELNGLDVTDMPIFKIPQQLAEETPVLGCLVAETLNQAPKCISPCPDPVKYPATCVP